MIPFRVQGQPVKKPEERPLARYYAITPNYLRVMGITLLRGRGFAASDSAGKPSVAIINQAFVEQFYAQGDVLGKNVTVALNSPSDQSPRKS